MEMILQNPYYFVSAVAGIAALGFMIAAVVFLLKDRPGKRDGGTDGREKKKKKSFKFQKAVSDSDTEKEADLVEQPDDIVPKEESVETSYHAETEAEEFQKKIIQTYQKSAGLRDMLEQLMEEGMEGVFGKNIQKAYQYLNTSRYRDFETTLEYLLDSADAEKLKEDLLQMEIVKHRRIEMRI